MRRPSAALLCAAAASVCFGFGAGCVLFPEEAAPLRVSETEPRRLAEPSASRAYPARADRLASPFLPEHPARSAKKAPPLDGAARPAAGRRAVPRVRLAGIVSSREGRRAILSIGGKQTLLAPGETREGVTLLALTADEATVGLASGGRVLAVGGIGE